MSDEEPPDERDADRRLVEELRRTGCRGRLWDMTVARLVGYARPVVTRLLHGGGLPAKSVTLGRPIRLADDEWVALTTFEAAEWRSALNEAMALGLDLFRSRAILGEQWSSDGGAGLETFFVNAVVMSLSNPIRRWQTGFRPRRWTEEEDLAADQGDTGSRGGHPLDPLDVVLASHDLLALFGSLDPLLREALFRLTFTDLTRTQIARDLGISRDALDRKLRRFRAQHSRDQHGPDQYGDNDD